MTTSTLHQGGPNTLTASGEDRLGWIAGYGLFILVLATVFGAVDRQILVLMAEPLRKALSLSDTDLGLIQGMAFSLFAGLAAFPIGWLADRYGRRAVLAVCVIVWSASTAACGFVSEFTGLFLAATGMGIGEAGIVPIIYGLIPQVVPERRRVMANGLYSVATLLGAGLGISMGGMVIEHVEPIRAFLPGVLASMDAWRLAFVLTAMPGPAVAVAIVLIRLHRSAYLVEAPQSRTVSEASPAVKPYFIKHWHTAAGVFGGLGLATMGLYAAFGWVPVLASRHYGIPASEVGKGIGAAYMVGTVAGAALGALGVRFLRPRLGLAMPMRVNALGMLVAACAASGYLFAQSAFHLYVLVGVQVASVIAGTVLIPTLMQDMTPAALRSRIIGLGGVVGVSLSALAPVLVGGLSDALRRHDNGLPISMVIVCSGSLLLAALLMQSAQAAYVRTVRSCNPGIAD